MLFFLTLKGEKRQNQKQPKANFSKIRLYKMERSFKIKVSIFRVLKKYRRNHKIKRRKKIFQNRVCEIKVEVCFFVVIAIR